MKGNFDKSLKEILIHEGGFVNDPRDPGGMTNLGVTKATYEAWIGHPVSEKIMRGLTPSLVAALYRKRYWDTLKCDDLPAGLDLCVFDFGVNAGPARAARYVQRIAGLPLAAQDGVIGPKTLAAIKALSNKLGAVVVIGQYQDMRRGYYRQLSHFPRFGEGWLSRVHEVERTARSMV